MSLLLLLRPKTESVNERFDNYMQAIVDQGGSVDSQRQSKVEALFNALEDESLIRYTKCLYLYLGNTYNSAKLNALNPTTLVGAFAGTWVGTPTLDINGGFTPSVGNYFNSNFHPDGGGLTDLTGGGMFFYGTQDKPAGDYPIGLSSSFFLAPNYNGSSSALICAGTVGATAPAVNTSGFHWGGREPNSSNIRAYRNGVVYISSTEAYSATGYAGNYPSTYARVGGRRDQVTPADNPSTMPQRVTGFTKGLVSGQVSTYYGIIQDLLA